MLFDEVLRDTTRYDHLIYACNGLSPNSPESETLDQCKLSQVGANDVAFLEGRSLIGDYVFTIRNEDLGGITPKRLYVLVNYTYDTGQ